MTKDHRHLGSIGRYTLLDFVLCMCGRHIEAEGSCKFLSLFRHHKIWSMRSICSSVHPLQICMQDDKANRTKIST